MMGQRFLPRLFSVQKAFLPISIWLFANSLVVAQEVQVEFERPVPLGEDLLVVCKSDSGPCGVSDLRGETILSLQFSEINPQFHPAKDRTLFIVKTETSYGMFDHTGNWKVQPFAQSLEFFHDGLAKFTENDKVGYVDETGKKIIPAQYAEGTNFSEGVASVKVETADHMLIDKNGKALSEAKYNNLFESSEGLSPYAIYDVKSDTSTAGFLDKSGKEVMAGNYELIYGFSEGLSVVNVDNKNKGMIDRDGQWVIPPKFRRLKTMSEGLAPAQTEDGAPWGFVDITGKFSIKPQFSLVDHFYEGYAAAMVNNKWGFIDHEGNWKIKPKFAGVKYFRGGAVAVNLGGKPNEYLQTEGGKWGLLDENGKWILKASFDKIYNNGTHLEVIQGKRKSYYSMDGKKIIDRLKD